MQLIGMAESDDTVPQHCGRGGDFRIGFDLSQATISFLKLLFELFKSL